MRPVVILFAKAPIAGNVKTRLTPHLTPEQAASVHHALVADAWERLGSIDADRELHTDQLTDAWPGAQPRYLQCEGDLGTRMLHALCGGLATHPRAIIVGSDAPRIPAGHLEALLEVDADVALGPTDDGGYYAIGCRRVDERMFARVRWSGPHAMNDTIAALCACGLSIAVGPPWHDIDTSADLARLPADLLRAAGLAHS